MQHLPFHLTWPVLPLHRQPGIRDTRSARTRKSRHHADVYLRILPNEKAPFSSPSSLSCFPPRLPIEYSSLRKTNIQGAVYEELFHSAGVRIHTKGGEGYDAEACHRSTDRASDFACLPASSAYVLGALFGSFPPLMIQQHSTRGRILSKE